MRDGLLAYSVATDAVSVYQAQMFESDAQTAA